MLFFETQCTLFNSPTILYSSSHAVIQCEYLQAIGSDSTGAAGKMPPYPLYNWGKVPFCPGTIMSRLQILSGIKCI